MLLQFSTTWEPVKFNAQAILTSLTGATTILIQLSPAGLIPGLMFMQLSPPTMAHSILLMQLSPTTLDHDQFSCNFQLLVLVLVVNRQVRQPLPDCPPRSRQHADVGGGVRAMVLRSADTWRS